MGKRDERDERETWTTEEFGTSHERAAGVPLADGAAPEGVIFDMGSDGGGQRVARWSVYDGRAAKGPRAAALRGVCSGLFLRLERPGTSARLGRDRRPGPDQGGRTRAADESTQNWDEHTEQVAASAIPLPEPVSALLPQLSEETEKLAKSSPLAAIRAARRLEVTAAEAAYWAGPRHAG